MVVSDAPSKIKRKPNKVKYNEDCPFTKLDECLKHELDQFQEKFHVDMWGNIADTLLGPHVFLTTPQIIHLFTFLIPMLHRLLKTLKITSNRIGCKIMVSNYLNLFIVFTMLNHPLLCM